MSDTVEPACQLSDYVQKYFTDRPRPQHPLDLDKLPATKEKLLGMNPDDMKLFAKLAEEIECDLKNGTESPDPRRTSSMRLSGPGAVLQTYVFALH